MPSLISLHVKLYGLLRSMKRSREEKRSFIGCRSIHGIHLIYAMDSPAYQETILGALMPLQELFRN